MNKLKEILSAKEFESTKKVPFPGFVNPMLATLTEDYFDSDTWIFERKLDGVRCLITIDNGKVNLFSRNENLMNNTYPELIKALEEQKYPNLIADGEIVAFEGKTTSFQKLQGRIHLKNIDRIEESDGKVFLYVFDLIYFEDSDITQLPLKSRKKILKKVMDWSSPIRYTLHRNTNGKEFLKDACEKGWEGIIAKDAQSPYVHSRSKSWLKFKCSLSQEFVIAGFTEPQGERIGFGALLIGYYRDGELLYAGKVGTGFDDIFLKEWRSKFDKIILEKSPFKDYKDTKNGNHWIKPYYVGQFGFSEWTTTNKLRHPRFLGIRTDKTAREVLKET